MRSPTLAGRKGTTSRLCYRARMSLVSSQHKLQSCDDLNDMFFIKMQLDTVHSAGPW